MTNNFTQLSIALTEALLPVRSPGQNKEDSRCQLTKLKWEFAMFVVGSAAGALGQHRHGVGQYENAVFQQDTNVVFVFAATGKIAVLSVMAGAAHETRHPRDIEHAGSIV